MNPALVLCHLRTFPQNQIMISDDEFKTISLSWIELSQRIPEIIGGWKWYHGRRCSFGGSNQIGFLCHNGIILEDPQQLNIKFLVTPYICYSETFSVPMLCFKMENSNDGLSCDLDVVFQVLQHECQNLKIASPLVSKLQRLLGVGNHPCIPYETVFLIEPCDTCEFMKSYGYDINKIRHSVLYLFVWWNFYGSLLGQSLDPHTYSEIIKTELESLAIKL